MHVPIITDTKVKDVKEDLVYIFQEKYKKLENAKFSLYTWMFHLATFI